ncbi:MAG: hypothetical protein ACKODX_18275 [Gemmata sp.]
MFTIRPGQSDTRRAFLKVGAMGLGMFGLPSLLRGNPGPEKPWVRDKSVVWVWLGGGPCTRRGIRVRTTRPGIAAS